MVLKRLFFKKKKIADDTDKTAFLCVLHTGANPLQTNGLGHTARAYAKEGDVSTVLQQWEGKV